MVVTPILDSQKEIFIKCRHSPNIKYYKDRLTIKYTSKSLNSEIIVTFKSTFKYKNTQSVQSNSPISNEQQIFYYEVKINDLGSKGEISIGFGNSEFPINKHPGQTKKYKIFHNLNIKKFLI